MKEEFTHRPVTKGCYLGEPVAGCFTFFFFLSRRDRWVCTSVCLSWAAQPQLHVFYGRNVSTPFWLLNELCVSVRSTMWPLEEKHTVPVAGNMCTNTWSMWLITTVCLCVSGDVPQDTVHPVQSFKVAFIHKNKLHGYCFLWIYLFETSCSSQLPREN